MIYIILLNWRLSREKR